MRYIPTTDDWTMDRGLRVATASVVTWSNMKTSMCRKLWQTANCLTLSFYLLRMQTFNTLVPEGGLCCRTDMSVLLSTQLVFMNHNSWHCVCAMGDADAEIKVPSCENTELKRSPFTALSRSEYSHTCYAYCQGFLHCLLLPFRFIHLHFFLKPLPIFPVSVVANI